MSRYLHLQGANGPPSVKLYKGLTQPAAGFYRLVFQLLTCTCEAFLEGQDNQDHQDHQVFEDRADHPDKKGRGVIQRLVPLNSDGRNN